MGCFSCPGSGLKALARAAAKSAAARLRRLGALPVATDWARRATICQQCPLCVVRAGISYCGTPFLRQVKRDPVVDGCGCPCRQKAQSATEHCPLNPQNRPAVHSPAGCDCKWCTAAQPKN